MHMPIRDSIVPLFHSRTLAYIASLALCVGLYSCLPILLTSYLTSEFGKIPSQFHAALSLVLGGCLCFARIRRTRAGGKREHFGAR